MITILTTLLNISIVSFIMIAITLCIKILIGKIVPIKLLNFLWILVLIRLIVPITIDSPIHYNGVGMSFENEIINHSHQTQSNYDYTPSTIDSADFLTPDNNQENTYSYSEITVNPTEETLLLDGIINIFSNINYSNAIAIVWISGALIVILNHLVSFLKFNKILMKSKQTVSADLKAVFKDSLIKLNINKNVELIECVEVYTPLVYGVFRPKIVLPANIINSIGKDKLTLIFMHELAHIKRMDVFKNYLWLIAKALHWYNPLVWIAYRYYLSDIELTCDEMIKESMSKKDTYLYTQSLLEVIKLAKAKRNPVAYLSICQNKNNIKIRIENMLNPSKKHLSAVIITLLATIVMIVGCFTTACQNSPVTTGNLKEIKSQISQLDPIVFEYTSSDTLQVNVNAEFIVPEVNSINILEIKPRNFTFEQADILKKYIVAHYNIGSDSDETPKLAFRYNGSEHYFWNLKIDNQPAIIEMHTSQPYLMTGLDFYRTKDGENGLGLSAFSWSNREVYKGVDIANMDKSYTECLQIAMDFVNSMDEGVAGLRLHDSSIYTDNNGIPAYQFYFTRHYPETYINLIPSMVFNAERLKVSFGEHESMLLYVNDEGVCQAHWSSYAAEYNILKSDIELLDINEIIKVFENACKTLELETSTHESMSENTGEPILITIDKVMLNNVIVNKDGSKSTIPVWEFLGKFKPINSTEEPFYEFSILTINAIDGSIVYK